MEARLTPPTVYERMMGYPEVNQSKADFTVLTILMGDRTTSGFLTNRELSRRLGCEGYEVTRFFSEAPNFPKDESCDS